MMPIEAPHDQPISWSPGWMGWALAVSSTLVSLAFISMPFWARELYHAAGFGPSDVPSAFSRALGHELVEMFFGTLLLAMVMGSLAFRTTLRVKLLALGSIFATAVSGLVLVGLGLVAPILRHRAVWNRIETGLRGCSRSHPFAGRYGDGHGTGLAVSQDGEAMLDYRHGPTLVGIATYDNHRLRIQFRYWENTWTVITWRKHRYLVDESWPSGFCAGVRGERLSSAAVRQREVFTSENELPVIVPELTPLTPELRKCLAANTVDVPILFQRRDWSLYGSTYQAEFEIGVGWADGVFDARRFILVAPDGRTTPEEALAWPMDSHRSRLNVSVDVGTGLSEAPNPSWRAVSKVEDALVP